MAGLDLRPNQLPAATSVGVNDSLVVDQDAAGVKKATAAQIVATGRPIATEAEAVAGTDNTKAMTPLRAAQAITGQGSTQFASSAQGMAADSALQPSSIGATVQAQSAKLDTIAGQTWAADQISYQTSASALGLASLTAFGRSLIAAANAAAARVVLGLGSLATLSSINNSNWVGDDLDIANGGTGASTASAARTNLSVPSLAETVRSVNGVTPDGSGAVVVTASVGNLPQNTIYGRISAGSGAGENLTPAQARTVIGSDNASNLTSGTLPDARVSNSLSADKAFRQGNILGTVSQSGGVPTGAVVEHAANSNGRYTRYADGTQICWTIASYTDQAINTTYNSLFQGTRTWTFPAAFSGSPPAVSCSQFRWGASASWGTVANVSTTDASLRGSDTNARAAGTSVEIAAIAIGRWF